MFWILIYLMILGSIALPRLANLRTPRTVKVSEPVPLNIVFDDVAARFMPAVRIRTPYVPKRLRR